MRVWFATLFLTFCFVLGSGLAAREPEVAVDSAQEDVVVGQPFIIRVKVLVPSFMPKPPVFPTFEAPGLIVRLPERSTQPVSERVDGETWSGVQRTYRIYPMRAGVTEIPAQSISIIYKDTATNEDVPLTAEVPATRIVATVPEGASTLDPLIIAQGLEIAQSWQVAEGALAVGDAVTRRLETTVAGTSALFVPPLLEAAEPSPGNASAEPAIASFMPYPEDAVVTESFDRGVMSGTVREEVSYIAQGGGGAEFPDINLEWYNTESGKLETITLEGRHVEVTMPPKVRAPIDREAARRKVLLLVLVVAVFWVAFRFVWPSLQPRVAAAQAQWLRSIYAAHRLAVKEASARNLQGLFTALDKRTARGQAPSDDLSAALEALTRALYRDGAQIKTDAQWQAVLRALRQDRPPILGHAAAASSLPRLNLFGADP